MQKLTQEQALVITGYTGFMACEKFSDFHADVERRLGHSVWTHQFPSLREKIAEAYKGDFLAMVPQTYQQEK